MSSHRNPKRSWPGGPNRYITSISSTVRRPKSMATVVVVLASEPRRWSTRAPTLVIAASVRSGGISDRAPTKVVLPAPKPPATTNFTARMRGFQSAPAERTSCWIVIVSSPGSHGVDHARHDVELDLHGIGLVHLEAALGDEVGGEDGGDADRSEEHTSELQSLMRISYA